MQFLDLGVAVEQTREAVCLFCRTTGYFPLSGKNGLVDHYATSHPQELPHFVNLLYTKVLPQKPEIRVQMKVTWNLHGWPQLLYPQPSPLEQTRFTLISENDRTVSLANVDEKAILYYFTRDIWAFQCLPHENVRYVPNPHFDKNKPLVTQLFRVAVGSTGESISKSRQALCMYCPQVTFVKCDVSDFQRHMWQMHKEHFEIADNLDPEEYDKVAEWHSKARGRCLSKSVKVESECVNGN